MKHKLLILLGLFALSSVVTFAYDFKVDGIYYNILDNGSTKTVEVTYEKTWDYPSYTGDVKIPETVEFNGTKYTVTSIGEYAFYRCEEMTSVNIPSSITSIERNAFSRCTGLSSVEIPNSVISIKDAAFWGCSGLTTLEIPSSITTIKSWTFAYCTGITTLEIPSSVTYIEGEAFTGCTSLTMVTISCSETKFASNPFSFCTALKWIFGPNTSEDNKCLIVDDVLIAFAQSGLDAYSIPDYVTYIESGAFSGCEDLSKVEIPNSVTVIGFNAFSECRGLETIEIPNSVTFLGYGAFSLCYSLSKVTLPNSITFLADNIFLECNSLTFVECPPTITRIGRGAFLGSGIIKVEIPSSVSSIGEYAFAECKDLTTVEFNAIECESMAYGGNDEVFRDCNNLTHLIIGADVESLPDNAFYGINQLEEVKVAWNIPEWVEIGNNVFSSVSNTDLLVTEGTINNYKNLLPWKDFRSIREYLPNGQLVEPCETPSISIDNNNLIFTSSTPGVKYNYTIKCLDSQDQNDSEDGIVKLSGIYEVSVYAYADGYSNSEIVNAIIVWVNPQIEKEDAGILSMEAKKAVLIKTVGDKIQICGTEYGETIQLYSIDGMMLESTKAVDGETTLSHTLQSEQIYIIRYGDKAIKYKF